MRHLLDTSYEIGDNIEFSALIRVVLALICHALTFGAFVKNPTLLLPVSLFRIRIFMPRRKY